jgi:hypothetical protein
MCLSWGIILVMALPIPVQSVSHAHAHGPEAVRHAGHKVVVVVFQRVLIVEDIGIIGRRFVTAAAIAAVHRGLRVSLIAQTGLLNPLQASQCCARLVVIAVDAGRA